VRLSLGKLWNVGNGMRSTGCCIVLLGLIAPGKVFAAAENTAATKTSLAVSVSNIGPRSRATLNAHVVASDQTGSPSGVVTFRSGETELGSAFLNADGDASLQTDVLTAGSHQVTAVYQGQGTYLNSVSKAEQVQAYVSTVAGFTVAATPTSLSTAVGGFVSSVVTVTPNNGFSGFVSLSCNGLPINTVCTFTPVSVPALCSSASVCPAGTSVMQIQTQAPSPSTATNSSDSGMQRYAFVVPMLFGLVGLGVAKRRTWRNLALMMVSFAVIFGAAGCAQRYRYLNHGPPGNPGTPVGNYSVTIAAQSSAGSQTTTPPALPKITLTVTAKT
jgi:Bacterial Ig-like domain (group 3)